MTVHTIDSRGHPSEQPLSLANGVGDAPDRLAVVREVCRAVGDRHGDAAALVSDEVRRLAPLCSTDERDLLIRESLARLDGLGELDHLLHDPDIDEVLVNAGREIWIDRGGKLERAGTLEDDRVDQLIERVLAPLGRRVDRSSPIVDARLPDGARVCVVLPPVSVDGPTMSIRRFRTGIRTVDAFADGDSCALLTELLDRRCNIVVSGATSSGKTSLLAALLATLPDHERLVVIEDTTELPLDAARPDHHLVRLEARPPAADGPGAIDLAQLVRTALRLRPDRIVVGEIRGDEVTALVQAMNTGHDGSISTCHANGPVDVLLRLESLVLQAAPSWPLTAIRHQLARSLDIVIHVERRPDSSTRRVVSISEVDHPGSEPDDRAPTLRTLASIGPTGRLSVTDTPTRGRR